MFTFIHIIGYALNWHFNNVHHIFMIWLSYVQAEGTEEELPMKRLPSQWSHFKPAFQHFYMWNHQFFLRRPHGQLPDEFAVTKNYEKTFEMSLGYLIPLLLWREWVFLTQPRDRHICVDQNRPVKTKLDLFLFCTHPLTRPQAQHCHNITS